MKVKVAVLPVAGRGTRVMPLTLHQSKAMIGIVDRPMIHYVIDEAVNSGINEIIIVAGQNKSEFKKYIDYLQKEPEWRKVKFRLAVQKNAIGNADAVFSARKFIKNAPFIVAFCDDLLDHQENQKSILIKMLEFFYKIDGPVILLEPVPKSQISKYGVVQIRKTKLGQDFYEITDIVEKPSPEKAPSNLAIIGRYVLNPEFLNLIEKLYPYQNQELYLTDAFKLHLKNGGKLYGVKFQGHRFDCGSKLGLLKAQAYFGVHHHEMGKEFQKYLKGLEIVN